jgi:hypothetical protein
MRGKGEGQAMERVRRLVESTEPWGDGTDREWIAALRNILADYDNAR